MLKIVPEMLYTIVLDLMGCGSAVIADRDGITGLGFVGIPLLLYLV